MRNFSIENRSNNVGLQHDSAVTGTSQRVENRDEFMKEPDKPAAGPMWAIPPKVRDTSSVLKAPQRAEDVYDEAHDEFAAQKNISSTAAGISKLAIGMVKRVAEVTGGIVKGAAKVTSGIVRGTAKVTSGIVRGTAEAPGRILDAVFPLDLEAEAEKLIHKYFIRRSPSAFWWEGDKAVGIDPYFQARSIARELWLPSSDECRKMITLLKPFLQNCYDPYTADF